MTFRPALVASSFDPHVGGVERVVHDLAAELLRVGESPLVVTNRWPRNLPVGEVLDGVEVHRIAFRVPGRSIRSRAIWATTRRPAARRLRRLSDRHGCRVINVHCVSTNGRYALELSERRSLPLVVSLHGELTADETGAYAPGSVVVDDWKRVIDHAALVTAPSRHALQCAETVYGCALGPRGRVVPNPVALSRSGSTRIGDRQHVLAVGRLTRVKGFDSLVRAWALVAVAPEAVAHSLLIAGDGPERDRLRDLVAELGLAQRVRLLGRLDRSAVRQAMEAAQVVVVPSREEAFGLVAVEALAAGSRVVATRVGGLPEILAEAEAGSLVPVDHPDELAAAIVTALRGPMDDDESARGVAFATRLSPRAYAASMLDCYRSVAE